MADDKIWIIKEVNNYFVKEGISPEVSDWLTVIAAILAVAITVYIIDLILNTFVIKILHKATAKTRTKWDDYLLAHDFFKRSSRLVITIVLIETIGYLLQGHSSTLIKSITIAMQLCAVIFIVMMIFSIIDSLYDVYKTLPRSKEKSIKSYIQTLKVVTYAVATVIVFVILFNLKITSFLTGIAAFAAVLTLVFKDTLLGFIASIQLSAQDMVRLGDWIELPASNANGIVMDMNLTTVKVQNWDNTFSFIPIYYLTSNPYINWRGMERGGGRRFARIFYIDFTTIATLSIEDIEALKDNKYLAQYYTDMVGGEDNEEFRTNVSLLRRYMTAYLIGHSDLNSSLTTMVRYRDMGDKGLPIQLYGFTNSKIWVEYEDKLGEVIEHMICAAGELGIRMFQRTGSYTAQTIKKGNETVTDTKSSDEIETDTKNSDEIDTDIKNGEKTDTNTDN